METEMEIEMEMERLEITEGLPPRYQRERRRVVINRKQQNRGSRNTADEDARTLPRIGAGSVGPVQYPLCDLVMATDNFSEYNRRGEGTFGVVYKGRIDGKIVAIKLLKERDFKKKLLKENSVKLLREFAEEVCLLASLNNDNLVKLLGFCCEAGKYLLVYEYISKGDLDGWLDDDEKREDLNWEKRFKIIKGIARGLSYLHHNSKLVVVHRDLKPANILLDADYNPKIADFGLSKVFETKDTHQISQKGAGTPGYIPPELYDGQYSPKSDVYSYGMIVLEILAGCTLHHYEEDHDRENLSHVMWEQWKNKWPLTEFIDIALQEDFEEDEKEIERCYRIGLLCVQENPKKRPDMERVLDLLDNDESLSTPSYPGFYLENKRSQDSSSDISENSDTIESDSGPEDASTPELQPLFITEYSPEDLNIITENFSSTLDKNHFQYMVSLYGQTVAVEETNMGSDILALEHPNIINILGYCSEVEQKYFIIYEYPKKNGHLADYLNGQDQIKPEHLEWGTRVKIIKGVARGISFLHHVFEDGYIIHGDLNPSKIYIDNSWNAKLCGFGSANVLFEDQDFCEFSEYETLQFIPPEVAAYGWYSKKSDVYNYGTILLQILVNTSVVDRAFFNKVWKKWEQDEMLELLDPKLNQCPDEEARRYFQIALLCVQYEPEKRPSMPEVLKMLNNDDPLPPPFNPIPSSSHATRLPEM